MFRGVGHRSFISQIKFDNYYLDELLKNRKDESQKKTNEYGSFTYKK